MLLDGFYGKLDDNSMNKKVAVLIPCYNESQTIERVVKDYREALPKAEIYVYDNNSTDGTGEIAKKAGAEVRIERKQGKGNVIRSMFREIEADCYLMVDGDGTYPAESAEELCDLVLEKGVDMAVGDRLSSTYFQENKRPFHNFGNRLVRGLINLIFRSKIRDIMTGYRAFSRDFVKTFPVLSKGFEIETEMTIHALDKNFFVEEIPVNYRDREAGSESKLNTVSDGVKVILTIVRLFEEYKPMMFFGIIGLVLLVLAVGFGVPVFGEYFATGLVLRFPTLIFAGFLMTIAILMFVCGIILQVVVRKHRQMFELFLIETSRRSKEK